MKLVKVEECITNNKKNSNRCPNCGFPLSPSNVSITHKIISDEVTNGSDCMECGYKITYTYRV